VSRRESNLIDLQAGYASGVLAPLENSNAIILHNSCQSSPAAKKRQGEANYIAVMIAEFIFDWSASA
jgi:hypothetical protein